MNVWYAVWRLATYKARLTIALEFFSEVNGYYPGLPVLPGGDPMHSNEYNPRDQEMILSTPAGGPNTPPK